MTVTFTATLSGFDCLYPPKIGGAASTPAIGYLNLGTPYATGGIAVTYATFDSSATALTDLICEASSLDGTIYFTYVSATGKVKAYNQVGTEIANGTNLSSANKSSRVTAYLT